MKYLNCVFQYDTAALLMASLGDKNTFFNACNSHINNFATVQRSNIHTTVVGYNLQIIYKFTIYNKLLSVYSKCKNTTKCII